MGRSSLTWAKEDYQKRPYKYALKRAQQRCENSNRPNYKYYGAKGIKCKLTLSDVKTLWERDKADKMIKPSLERRDHNKNYTLDNCRFVENSSNIGEMNQRTKSRKVKQYSLDGKFIKEWNSVREAERITGFNSGGISAVCLGKQKTCGGFIWKHKNVT